MPTILVNKERASIRVRGNDARIGSFSPRPSRYTWRRFCLSTLSSLQQGAAP